jgi:uncharacterized DUF497 family protein
VRFEWDDNKNTLNRKKHGLSFETAGLVFSDPLALSVLEQTERVEKRWRTLGRVGGHVVLLVAHTVREEDGDEVIRIISARKATQHERRQYEQGQ